MAQFVKTFVQDLTQDIRIRQCGTIVFNADNDSNVISVSLYNGTEEYSGGGTVSGACICPDGSTVPLTGSLTGNVASITLTGDCFAFPGQIGIGIQVVSGTVRTTVLKAVYNVELYETDTVIDPGSRITISVGDLIQEIEDALANIPASDTNLKAALAPVFSTSAIYSKGQYAWYNGQLYKFTSDHAAGAWNADESTAAKAANDIYALGDLIGASAVVVPRSYTKNNADIMNVVVGRNGKDVSFEVLAQKNNIGVYSSVLFYGGKKYAVSFDIAASVSGAFKINTDFGIVEFQDSGHFEFVYEAPSNKSNIFYTSGTANPLCTISVTNFTVYEVTGEYPAIYPRVVDAEKAITDNAEAARVLKNCRLIGLNGGYPEFDGNYREKIIFNWGSASVYIVLNGGAQTAYTFADIATDIPDYAVVDGTKITITMPNIGALGFDTASNHFVMLSGNFNLSASVRPLYYRYYQVCFGELFDQRYVQDYPTIDSAVRNTFNSSYHTGAQDFAGKCQEFSAYLLGTTGQTGSTDADSVTAPDDFETFLFFTDPHLLEGSAWQNRCYEYMSQIQKYYNSVPMNFCLCGGDWLGNADLPAEATFKMCYIDGFMHSKFRDCYMLVGNHDTNYQGKKDAGSANFTTRLSEQSIADLWYRDTGRAYYRFDGCHSRFYCFDTGKENQPLAWYGNYGMNQAKWFAESLQTDDSQHIVMSAHIFYNNYDASASTNVIHPLTVKIFDIAQAYNARGTITVGGTTYDFTGRTGKVEYFIGGHTHADLNGVLNGIPWVLTTWVRDNRASAATFDLCMADYGNHVLHMVRVGGGSSRDISLNS